MNKLPNPPPTVQSKPYVPYLSMEEADYLLEHQGIPQGDLLRYKNTVYCSNASFWHHLYLMDRIDALILKGDRIFSKPRSRPMFQHTSATKNKIKKLDFPVNNGLKLLKKH